jgi:tetratricopeptide (TPR) repeat protein
MTTTATRLENLLALYEEDNNDAFVRYGIALEYNALKDYNTAITWFEALRTNVPDYVPTYYMLAGVYRAMGKLHDAKAVYEEGLQAAQRAGDSHAFAELSAALEELEEEL